MTVIPLDLWASVQAAAANNPQPLLEAADWCDEQGEMELAYALRWCAGKSLRPFFRADRKRTPWNWLREQRGLAAHLVAREIRERKNAILPRPIFDVAKYDLWFVEFSLNVRAYRWLARHLADLRQVVEVRSIILPPAPEIVRTGPVTCAKCGIVRARDVLDCPLCKSSNIKEKS